MNDIMDWVYDDGGRKEAGWKGSAGDCVVRAIAIATALPYNAIYETMNEVVKLERPRRGRTRSSARNGVSKASCKRFMTELGGWTWTPTMGIGTGTTVHLRQGELPMGRLIVACSKHWVAVIDGVIHDTADPSRDGTRAVYGYWRKDD